MEIVACICAFEAEQTLQRTLDSLKELVDRIIIVDGSWKGFADYAASKDRTVEIASSYPKTTVIPAEKPYETEMEKRTQYLNPKLVKEDDWLLIIDDDEFLTQGMAETRKILSATREPYFTAVLWDKQEEGRWSRRGEYVRLIRYIPGMKYGINPWTIELPNKTSVPLKATPAPLHIAHDQLSKPQFYREAKEKARKSGCFGKIDEVKPVAPSDQKRKRGRPRKTQPEKP